jgi:hypothetical protein
MPYLPITKCRWKYYGGGVFKLYTMDYLIGWTEARLDPGFQEGHIGEVQGRVSLIPPGKGCDDYFTFHSKTYVEAWQEVQKYIRKDVKVFLDNEEYISRWIQSCDNVLKNGGYSKK